VDRPPTLAATRYAVRELARRAGVAPADFRRWHITVASDRTVVFPDPDSGRRISFVRGLPAHDPSPAGRTVRAPWMREPAAGVAELVRDFIIPFCGAPPDGPRSLFSAVGRDHVESAFDLPSSTLLTLSRDEETVGGPRDAHGRFPASSSRATRDAFLERPIVDEYGLGLEQALRRLLPGWSPAARKPRVAVSHDIDQVGLPRSPRQALGHTLLRRRPLATVRDLLGPCVGLRPTYLALVERIVEMSLRRGLRPAVFWKASARTQHDSGYDIGHPAVREVVERLREQGVEVGIHPGYHTYRDVEALREEVQRVRRVLGPGPLGGRQHYLRWCPATWSDWEACGLVYDSTVGYADRIGFRAGTCLPYRPWLPWLDREANVVEVPLLVMDCTLFEYMTLSPAQALAAITQLLARTRLVGGVFTVLWHNTTLMEARLDGGVFARLLDALAGLESYRWEPEAAE
jgi:hypothetical protein